MDEDIKEDLDHSHNEGEHLTLDPDSINNYGLTSNLIDKNSNKKLDKIDVSNEEKSPAESVGCRSCVQRFLAARRYWVEPAFMLFQMSVWSLTPLVNQYIYAVIMEEWKQATAQVGNETEAEINSGLLWVEKETSAWVLYLELLRSIPSMFSTLIILSYSDIIGRKLGLFLPCIGGALKSLVYLLTSVYNASLYYLVIGHVVEGLCGTQMTMAGSAYAYVADVVPPERRTFRYIVLNTFLLIGITLGNICVGYIIAFFGYTASFFYTILVFLLAATYILILVPESLKRKDAGTKRTALEIAKETLKSLQIYYKRRPGRFRRARLLITLLILMLTTLTLMGLVNVQTLYLLGRPFNFGSVKLAYFLAEGAILNAIGPLLAVLILQKYCSDVTIGTAGALSAIVGFTLCGLAYNDVMVYLVPVFNSFMAAIIPIARAMLSNGVDQDEQGALQAGISTLNTINDVLGVTLHIGVYTATVSIFNGLVFLMIAAIFLVVFVLFFVLRWLNRKYPISLQDQEHSGEKSQPLENQTD